MAGFEGVAHPKQVMAPVAGGRALVAVRPWSMAQRAELKPLLLALLDRLSKMPATGVTLDIASMLAAAEEEVAALVRASVARSLIDADLKWDDLDWEDVLILAQAVWETSVVRPDGGGVGGKLMSAAFMLVSKSAGDRAEEAISPPTTTNGKPAASPSLPGAGELIRSPSATG